MATAVALVVVAAFSLADALANVVARAAPAAALAVAPWNAEARGRYAEREFAKVAKPATNSASSLAARETLRRDALNTDALNVLGLQAQLRNDTEVSRRIFAYALAISRRELAARLWAIEEAVVRGDIAEALANYDIALRTSAQAGPMLNPQLANALVEPLITRELLPVLARRPDWSNEFFAVAARNGRFPDATLAAVAFFGQARARNIPIAQSDQLALVDSLVVAGQYEAAWNHYARMHPGARRSTNRDPRFQARLAQPTSFDWTALDYGSLQIDRDGGHLRYDVPTTLGGVVARQYLFLPPGNYRMMGRYEPAVGGSPTSTEAAPYWQLSCEDGREVGRTALPVDSAVPVDFQDRVVVPTTCRFQMLTLVVRPSDQIGGAAGIVRRLVLEPVPSSAILPQ